MNCDEKSKVLNIVLVDRCPDDMESWMGIISFDVLPDVIEPKEEFNLAVNEYVSGRKSEFEPEDEDDEFSICWEEVFNHMPDELFSNHGLIRRRKVTDYVMMLNTDDEPELDE